MGGEVHRVKTINQWLAEIIADKQDQSFYGKLVLHFEKGNLTLVREEKTLKPPNGDGG